MKKIILIQFLLFLLGFPIYGQSSNNSIKCYTTNMNEDIIEGNQNKIIVINIWNPDHIKDLYKLNHLVEKYKTSNVVFLAITDDDTEKVSEFLSQNEFNYQHIHKNLGEKIFNQLQTGMFKAYPIHVVIDQKGTVTYIKKKSSKNIEYKLSKRIDQLLKNDVYRFSESKNTIGQSKSFISIK